MHDTAEPVAAELKPEGFNSLFEMRNTPCTADCCMQLQRVSILYLRCRCRATACCAIFYIILVSILYLRCRPGLAGAEATDGGDKRVSILYLRCAFLEGREVALAIGRDLVSILYLRCP